MSTAKVWTGTTWERVSIGRKGDQGDKGDKGDKGDQGIQGQAAMGVIVSATAPTNPVAYQTVWLDTTGT